MPQTLQEQLPWTQTPLIVNAPMGGFAGGSLAAAVTKAGGLGQIGAVMDMAALEQELEIARDSFDSNGSGFETPTTDTTPSTSTTTAPKILPIGVGLLPFIVKLSSALPVLQKYRPAVVWLFAAKDLADYADWTRQLHASLPETSVWIQVGSASAALQVARGDAKDSTSQPDALVLQGSDAGGHGMVRSASIVSLIPETVDLLRTEQGLSSIPILAAGGIADARGAAAALSLGAAGVVLGTRFLAASETVVPHEAYRDTVLKARDGANTTVRSTLFDNVAGPNIWPQGYDGRGVVTQSWRDFVEEGVSIEEVRTRYHQAAKGEGRGLWSGDDDDDDAGTSSTATDTGDNGDNKEGRFGTGRANIWAGASIGLVNKMENAADIVKEVRAGVVQVLKSSLSLASAGATATAATRL